jgi:two-component system, LuxR family, sensor kinase FixL
MFSRETQALMEAAVDAIIVIDDRGLISAANDATLDMFGYESEELLGENVSILMPEPDRGAHDDYMRNHLRTGRARIIGRGREVIAKRKDGTLFPAHLSVGCVRDADPAQFVGIVRDTTSEHEALAALKLERDRAAAYLELHDSILLTLDAERRIREINARGSDLLGAPRQELLGRDWLEFIRGTDECERGRLLLESALSNGASREREFESRDAGGAARRIHWRCIARRAPDGTPAGWLCSGVDVTDRARREELALLAQERLTRVARFATLGEMAAGVAHELNQPLTAIATYARACEHFLDSPQPDLAETREAVREIGAEGLRAGAIIQRLRQLVRGEHQAHAPTDLNCLIEELRALLLADAKMHDTTLRIGMSPGPLRVNADAIQIQQVILNLVKNALEALADIPAGSREISLTTARMVDGSVELRVADNGPGIAPGIVERLFEPFATTKKTGTGLGLASSRTIVQAHGGTIGARPGQPRGAIFFARLPAVEENA